MQGTTNQEQELTSNANSEKFSEERRKTTAHLDLARLELLENHQYDLVHMR